MTNPDIDRADDLFERLRPLLAGQGPGVQGAALAQCLAAWLAGHPPELRNELLSMHLAAVVRLVPVMHTMLREDPHA